MIKIIEQIRSLQKNLNEKIIIGVKTYNRSQMIRRVVNSLRKTVDPHIPILIYDDFSTEPSQVTFLNLLIDDATNKNIQVVFHEKNMGSNGNNQRFLDYFFQNKIQKWILVDDDCSFTKKDWINDIVIQMDENPHLFIMPKYEEPTGIQHPHGFFLTGTYEMLRKVGPYDLKSFPLRYGDCHADFTSRCRRLGYGEEARGEFIDYKKIFGPSANPVHRKRFFPIRAKYDAIVEDESRTSIPWGNGNLNFIGDKV